MIKDSIDFVCEGYGCSINMTIDEAIAITEKWLEKNAMGQMPLDSFAQRCAIQIIINEIKKRKQEFQ